MKNKQAFTLIELLVVVLIIGILAAVALPQYQKAVEKSRAAQAITLIRRIGEAGEAYHLASGEWPSSFDEIGIEPPSWTGTTKGYTNAGASDAVSNSDWSLQWWSSGNGSSGIVITRMTGPYAGAGFTWAFERNDALVPTKQVVCTERLANGVTFSGTAGDYCQKLFRGTLKATFEHRFYALP